MPQHCCFKWGSIASATPEAVTLLIFAWLIENYFSLSGRNRRSSLVSGVSFQIAAVTNVQGSPKYFVSSPDACGRKYTISNFD